MSLPNYENGNSAHPGSGSFFPSTSESQHLVGKSDNIRLASNGWQRYDDYPYEVNDVDIHISANSKELSHRTSRQTSHNNRFVVRLCRLCVRFFLRLILP